MNVFVFPPKTMSNFALFALLRRNKLENLCLELESGRTSLEDYQARPKAFWEELGCTRTAAVEIYNYLNPRGLY